MMPVTLAAFGEGAAVGLVSCSIEQLARRPVPGHSIALEITDMGAQRSRRAQPAHHSRLDDGATGATVKEPRSGEARRAAASKRAAASRPATREATGLLRGFERLRQEGF